MSDLENHTTYYFGHFPLWIWQDKTNEIKRAEILKKMFLFAPFLYQSSKGSKTVPIYTI